MVVRLRKVQQSILNKVFGVLIGAAGVVVTLLVAAFGLLLVSLPFAFYVFLLYMAWLLVQHVVA